MTPWTQAAAALLLLAAAGQDKKETDALNAAADELLKLSRLCSGNKAYSEARAECERGLRHLDSPKLRDEAKKLEGLKDAPPKTFAKRLDAERPKAHEKCALLLADAAAAATKRGRTEASERHLRAIQQDFPSEKAFAKLDLAWFDPYLRWLPREEAKKLERGLEQVDGKWLEAPAVEALNRKHATWDDSWVVSDGVHELHTTLPLRTARRLLSYVGAYRAFFLREFAGGWDLRPPSGMLPVFVTETQQAFREQMKKRAGNVPLPAVPGAAYYMQTNSPLNPCFVTLEPSDAAGQVWKTGLENVVRPLTHELTHQIAFEYSKHDYDRTRLIRHQFWAVEGIATFMQAHAYEKGAWRLRRPRAIPLNAELAEQGPFTLCVENVDRLPPLSRFLSLTQAEIMTLENYSIAATLANFFLRGEEGAYRAGFVRLLERVHKVRDTETLFAECFEGAELKALDEQFRKFVRQIRLE